MDERWVEYMKHWNLHEDRHLKLFRRINTILETCRSSEDLIVKFAVKCYGSVSDRELANERAADYLKAVFGCIETLFLEGPKGAIDLRLYEQKKQKPYWIVKDKFKHYKIGHTLGGGVTAKVKLGWDTNARREVALKIMKQKSINMKYAKQEVEILQSLNHRNIVQFYESFEDVTIGKRKTTVFALEYACHGMLIDYLQYTPKFEDELARWFFSSLVAGIRYCHRKKIIHRDLKHDNCLLGENFVLKISDFGFSTFWYNEKMKTEIGTPQYVAPEILAGEQYTGAVDIFSMGVMLFIAITGTMPWRTADPKTDKWYRWVNNEEWDEFFEYHADRVRHEFTEDQKAILMGLLDPEPKNRWTFDDIQRCRWYRGRTIDQNDVAFRMLRRRRAVDIKKNNKQKRRVGAKRRAVGIYGQRLPDIYYQPLPPLSFITDKKAEWALEDIENAIGQLRGSVDNKENYKLNFHVNKKVDTGRYCKGKKTKKKYDLVRVNATVQMWTLQGQNKALGDRAKLLKAASRKTGQTEEALDEKNTPAIKSIAIFRAEGGSEAKYLFPSIYSDILVRLPAEIICKDTYDDDLKVEKLSTIV